MCPADGRLVASTVQEQKLRQGSSRRLELTLIYYTRATWARLLLHHINNNRMRRALGAFGGAARNLAPQMMSSSTRASVLPNRYAVHLARVREAMEELAPPGQALECEGRALAAAQASQAWDDNWYKSPAENYVTANALFTVSALKIGHENTTLEGSIFPFSLKHSSPYSAGYLLRCTWHCNVTTSHTSDNSWASSFEPFSQAISSPPDLDVEHAK